MLKAGIVGLPNVGKSTLFNAVTKVRKAQAENYPFCTIEPNVGIVTVPDPRVDVLGEMSSSAKKIPAVIEMVDIAGLVKGASEGEGLGNKFLSHIREVDAIVQVVRCFEDENVHHVNGSVDPLRDMEVIMTELILADMDSLAKQMDKTDKKVRGQDKEAKAELEVMKKIKPHLDEGKPALTCNLSDDERKLAKAFFLMTMKPTIFACNVKEDSLNELESGQRNSDEGKRVQAIEDYCHKHLGAKAVVISAQIESDLIDLSPQEQQEYLQALGVKESGTGHLIRATYDLLGLQTYLTTGEKETRAWTVRKGAKAPEAAGVIHTDFERGFIAAETISYEELVEFGSFVKAREAGRLRIEGKDYVVQDGDVMEFRFNV